MTEGNGLGEASRPTHTKRHGLYTCAVVAIGAIALLGAAQTGWGQRALRAAGVARAYPSYFELYFLHPTQLPVSLDREQDTVIRFAVRSASPDSQQIGWYAFAASAARQHEVGHGRLSVAPGAVATVDVHVHVRCNGASRVQLRVVLQRGHARIEEWLTCRRRRH